MKLEIESTDRIVNINNELDARVWQGQTDSGLKVAVLVPRIAISEDQDDKTIALFKKEMSNHFEPFKSTIKAFPTKVQIID